MRRFFFSKVFRLSPIRWFASSFYLEHETPKILQKFSLYLIQTCIHTHWNNNDSTIDLSKCLIIIYMEFCVLSSRSRNSYCCASCFQALFVKKTLHLFSLLWLMLLLFLLLIKCVCCKPRLFGDFRAHMTIEW